MSSSILRPQATYLTRALVNRVIRRYPQYVQQRRVADKPSYEGHIPLNWFENAFLAVGSAVMSLADPRRGGTVYFL